MKNPSIARKVIKIMQGKPFLTNNWQKLNECKKTQKNARVHMRNVYVI